MSAVFDPHTIDDSARGGNEHGVRASKKDRAIALDVKVVHRDAMQLPADPSFALMMLHEAAESTAPLAEAVGFDDTLDATWMKKFAAGFIASVKVSNIKKRRRP
jgi:hypothetical protein